MTQRWTVPGAAGPAAGDLSTVAHTYGSTVNPVGDYYSGLIGISMISAAGHLMADGKVRKSCKSELNQGCPGLEVPSSKSRHNYKKAIFETIPRLEGAMAKA